MGAAVIDWIAYGSAARLLKGATETFGKGDVRGLIAAESANNAREGGALIPTLAFGVPGAPSMALLMGAFLAHGIAPGPKLLDTQLDLTYTMIWTLALANVVGRRHLLPVGEPARPDRDAALRHPHPDGVRRLLRRRLPGHQELRRSRDAGGVRHHRMVHEAPRLGARAAHPRLRPRQADREVSLHFAAALPVLMAGAAGRHCDPHNNRARPALADRIRALPPMDAPTHRGGARTRRSR